MQYQRQPKLSVSNTRPNFDVRTPRTCFTGNSCSPLFPCELRDEAPSKPAPHKSFLSSQGRDGFHDGECTDMSARLPSPRLTLVRQAVVTDERDGEGGRFQDVVVLRHDVVVAIRQDGSDCWLHAFRYSQPWKRSSRCLPQVSAIAICSSEQQHGPGHFTLVLDSPNKDLDCLLHPDLQIEPRGQRPLSLLPLGLKDCTREVFVRGHHGHRKTSSHQALIYRAKRKLYRWEVMIEAGRARRNLRNEEDVLKTHDRHKKEAKERQRSGYVCNEQLEQPMNFLTWLGYEFKKRFCRKHHRGEVFAITEKKRQKLARTRICRWLEREHEKWSSSREQLTLWGKCCSLISRIKKWLFGTGGNEESEVRREKIQDKLAAMGGVSRSFVRPHLILFIPSKKLHVVLVDSFTQQIKRIDWRKQDRRSTWEWPRSPFQGHKFECLYIVPRPGSSTNRRHRQYFLVVGDWEKKELIALSLDQGHKIGSTDISGLPRPEVIFVHDQHLCYLNASSRRLYVFGLEDELQRVDIPVPKLCSISSTEGLPSTEPEPASIIAQRRSNWDFPPEQRLKCKVLEYRRTEPELVPSTPLPSGEDECESSQPDSVCSVRLLFDNAGSSAAISEEYTTDGQPLGSASEQEEGMSAEASPQASAADSQAFIETVEWAPLHLAFFQSIRQLVRNLPQHDGLEANVNPSWLSRVLWNILEICREFISIALPVVCHVLYLALCAGKYVACKIWSRRSEIASILERYGVPILERMAFFVKQLPSMRTISYGLHCSTNYAALALKSNLSRRQNVPSPESDREPDLSLETPDPSMTLKDVFGMAKSKLIPPEEFWMRSKKFNGYECGKSKC